MRCDNCGKELQEGAKFCTNCGLPVKSDVATGSEERAADNGSAPKSKSNKKKIIALVVVLLVVAVVAGVWGALFAASQETKRAESGHAITIAIDAPDTLAGGTRVPVQVTGTTSSGQNVSESAFVDASGEGLQLQQGTYEMRVTASPFLSGGGICSYSSTAVTLEVPSDLEESEPCSLADSAKITLSAKDVSETEQSEVDLAYQAAKLDSENAQKAEELYSQTSDQVEAYKAEQEAEKKRQEEEAAKQVSASSYGFSIPDYWVGRVKVVVSGNEVSILSKNYPSRDICTLSYVSQPSEDWGDIGGSIMSCNSLSGGGYVEIHASRWTFLACDCLLNGSNYVGLTQAEAEELIDLQTGGQVSFQQLKERVAASGLSSSSTNELVFEVDDYLNSTIAPTIAPK